ncbi:hypothetical protein GE09DRAFT_331449 [Coniochaeta sp. 2T2.1]|nr:hypothetical protein GE09DRAFT_331449 [Coniochaeta sp. 2T2.1]
MGMFHFAFDAHTDESPSSFSICHCLPIVTNKRESLSCHIPILNNNPVSSFLSCLHGLAPHHVHDVRLLVIVIPVRDPAKCAPPKRVLISGRHPRLPLFPSFPCSIHFPRFYPVREPGQLRSLPSCFLLDPRLLLLPLGQAFGDPVIRGKEGQSARSLATHDLDQASIRQVVTEVVCSRLLRAYQPDISAHQQLGPAFYRF